MSFAVKLAKAVQVAVHAVLPSHLCALREVVYHLVHRESLVDLTLYIGACPKYGPRLILLIKLSEAIVFERESNQIYVSAVVEFEEVALVGWHMWSQRHRVYVRPKNHVLFL